MRSLAIRAAPFAAIGLVLLVAGCGYRFGPAPVVNDARSVALPLFENRTFRRGVETDLGRLLVTEVKSRTALVIGHEGSADLVVKGAIVNIEEKVMSQDKDQVIRESSIIVTAEVNVLDGRTGEPVVPRMRLTEREPFVPRIGESVRSARIEALKRLASDVVDRLEADGTGRR
ncbi:MAG: LPS assembly lipoprotein LptE [Planctomycetota bacterium]